MVQDGPDRTEAGDFTAETFSSVMISSSGGGEECWPGVRAEKRLRPTLGTGWYHVVTTRLILAASTRFHSDGGSRAPDDLAVSSGPAWCVGQRYCSIAKSPMCRLFSVPYIIDAKGVVDV